AVNLSVDKALLTEARAHEINVSATLESALREELRRRQRSEWLEKNQRAIKAYNADIDAHGFFSDGVRTF
ncbi:type II toxin-antitoxin system CcdA family antitoxin, partial [Enterococcus casseliflavus]|uniref:type II toxin-antitoxin system CcdA family antitoxin n=1 Tax=Enterococcus casseliflavus TaxID=37734 RepID=UPI003D134238